MADSPSKSMDKVLAWSVYCNEKQLDASYELTYAFVHFAFNRIGKATLKFNAGNMDKQTFAETDSSDCQPGHTIRLDVGDIHNQKTLFEGIILEVGIRIDKGFRSQMVVECRDNAYPATQGRKNRIFEKKKDSDIINEVLSDYGTVKVDTTGYEHPEMVQYYCTDWDFALSRADACGLLVFTQGKEIRIEKPQVNASPILTVTYGADMISFDCGLSSNNLFGKYEAVSWDSLQQKQVKVMASPPSLNKQGDIQPTTIAGGKSMLLQTDAPMNNKVLKEWADSMALKAGLARYQGKCSFYGSAKVLPGSIIEVKGLGKRFSGDVFVGSVTHTIKNNQWITEAGIGLENTNITDEPDVVTPPASGFIPGLEGLHIGVVKQLEQDPQKEFRIQIELPWMEGEKKELWARLSTFYATGEAGVFFLPEKGDEVLIGFINHNPAHPIVLGSLYGSKHKSPYEYKAENHEKGIVTRSKLTIAFDEEKKIITLHTPEKSKIEINDDAKSITLTDPNKNEIVMDKNGISLTSSKDIQLKAKGNITLDATGKANVTAKQDVAIEGMNVKLNAKIGLAAKGSATAELSASGQTTVKGAMVMIN